MSWYRPATVGRAVRRLLADIGQAARLFLRHSSLLLRDERGQLALHPVAQRSLLFPCGRGVVPGLLDLRDLAFGLGLGLREASRVLRGCGLGAP